jgi:hypothetical protein
MRRLLVSVLLASLVVATPVPALAQTTAAPAAGATASAAPALTLNFRDGYLHDLFTRIMGIAKGALPFMLLLALVLEAFGRAPGVPREYGAVVWRLLIVLVLLLKYQYIFGWVINTTGSIAAQIQPKEMISTVIADVAAKLNATTTAAQAAGGGASNYLASAWAAAKENFSATNQLYSALTFLFGLLCEAVVFVINYMSKILTGTFFLLGPLALVTAIPRSSKTGGLWFKHFVTVSCWPIFTALLLAVLDSIVKQGSVQGGTKALEAVVASAVLALTAASAPKFASHIIGGGFEAAAAAGTGVIQNMARHATSTTTHAATNTTSSVLSKIPVVGPAAAIAVNTLGRVAQHAIVGAGAARVASNQPGQSRGGGRRAADAPTPSSSSGLAVNAPGPSPAAVNPPGSGGSPGGGSATA